MAISGCTGLTYPGDGVTKEEGGIISPTVHIPNHYYVPNIFNSCLDSAGPIPHNQIHRNPTTTIFGNFTSRILFALAPQPSLCCMKIPNNNPEATPFLLLASALGYLFRFLVRLEPPPPGVSKCSDGRHGRTSMNYAQMLWSLPGRDPACVSRRCQMVDQPISNPHNVLFPPTSGSLGAARCKTRRGKIKLKSFFFLPGVLDDSPIGRLLLLLHPTEQGTLAVLGPRDGSGLVGRFVLV